MHCTQGSFVYRLKILHNHTASHKVLILSIKYSQDRIRGVFPSVLGVLSKVHSHGLSYFWRNPEPHDGSWPGAPGTRWFVWIVDVGRESSLPSPVFLFLLWEGGREGGREGRQHQHLRTSRPWLTRLATNTSLPITTAGHFIILIEAESFIKGWKPFNVVLWLGEA